MTANDLSRRDVLKQAAGAALIGGAAMAAAPATATPAAMEAAIRKVVGTAAVKPGRVKLDLPPLVESGNSVTVAVAVDSPMTASDYVRAIHIFNEKNPQPNVISVRLGPRAGKAVLSTRLRLSDTQDIVAIAELSDGTFWSDRAAAIVTLGACLED
jgi:sulfur-oxidizing protein SoxY